MSKEAEMAELVVSVRQLAFIVARKFNWTIEPDDLCQIAWMRIAEEWDTYKSELAGRKTWAARVALWAMKDAIKDGHMARGAIRVTRVGYRDGYRPFKSVEAKPHHCEYEDQDKPNRRDFTRCAEELCGRALSAREKDALWFYLGEEKTLAEVGEIVGVSSTQVYDTLQEVLDVARKRQCVVLLRVPQLRDTLNYAKRVRNGTASSGRATTQRSGQTS